MDLPEYLRFFSPSAYLFIIAVIGFICYRRLSTPYRWLVILTAALFVSELTANILRYKIGYTYPPYHFLIPVEIVLYTIIYIKMTEAKKELFFCLLILCGIALCFYIYDEIKFASLFVFPSVPIMIMFMMVVFYSLILFYKMLKKPVFDPLYRQPVFWFNIGNLFFYCMNFFFLGFYSLLSQIMDRVPQWGSDMNFIINFVLYSTYLAAILIESKKGSV